MGVSPTDGIGPTQGQRKTLTRVGIEPTTFITFVVNVTLTVVLQLKQVPCCHVTVQEWITDDVNVVRTKKWHTRL